MSSVMKKEQLREQKKSLDIKNITKIQWKDGKLRSR